MKILLTGGGSGGSVSPLLAVRDELSALDSNLKFVFVGGLRGPEKILAEGEHIKFYAIAAGKWRRYFSFYNLLTPFLVLRGFWQARKILKVEKPSIVFGTGSFVQVPVVLAARSLNIPVVLHQQDVWPSMANKLCQFFAEKITVTFEKSLTDFSNGSGVFYKVSESKVVLTGNPFRTKMLSATKAEAEKFFGLNKDLPTILVLGGGTGAENLNKAVIKALPELQKFVQVIHITGKGKSSAERSLNYFPFEFTLRMAEAYAAADIVVSRAGLSTLTELGNLKKVSVLVPMPNSHQEFNALLLAKMDAALLLPENPFFAEMLVKLIRKLLFDYETQKRLSLHIGKIMPKDASEKVAKLILKVAEKYAGKN